VTKALIRRAVQTCVLTFALVSLALLSGCGGGSSSSHSSAPAVLQSIQITPSGPSIAAGLGQQFTATGRYSDGASRDLTKSVSWSSSNTNVASIGSSGAASTKTPGSTTITATYSAVSGSTTLTVTAAALVLIAISPATPSIALGTSLQFMAMGTFTDGSNQDLTNTASWSSSNPSAATISSSGFATSAAMGSTMITAASSGVSGSTSLTVTAPALVSMAVSPSSVSIAASTTTQFTATGTFTDGSTQNITSTVNWSSSNPAVASIDVNGVAGLAKGLTPGTSIITASSGSIASNATLTVTNASLLSIVVSPANPSIPLGTLQQFTATGNFSDGTTQDITGTVTWTSSNNRVASITTGGLATARNLGSVTITATSGSVSGSTQATVNAANLASLAVIPNNATIAQGTRESFSAIGTFNDGSTHDLTVQCSWSSSNPDVAKVGANSGIAKGLSPGITTITAALGSISASATLEVTNATIVSISITPVNRTIAPGTQLSFVATGTFSDSSTQVINRDSNWTSDNPAVATVGPGGTATGVAAGTANISATFNGVTGSATLNVSSATLTSITVTPATAVLAPASSLAYTATGTYSDGSKQVVTSVVSWTSSAPDVVSISGSGQATGQSAGTALITAQLAALSGTANVVVEGSPLTMLQVTPASATVAQQTGVQFSVLGEFADGSAQDLTNSATWTSSSPSVATVSNVAGTKGMASGITPGTSTIAALFGGEVGTASLTVTNATLTSIVVSPSSASIGLGSSQQFSATGNFSDGSTENLRTQVDWESSNVNVATISAFGLASSAGTGTATITASMNGVSGTAVLTVQ